ncbi:hypothetical protein ILUMI_15474, partial [Ignelater luminosus]
MLNRVVKSDYYPLPNVDDILSSMAGGEVLTVLDLSCAYQQLAVDKKSQELLTTSTHIGLFSYTRLTYGLLEMKLIVKVVKVLDRLQEFNMKVNLSKCVFITKNVEYLGHSVDKLGIHPTSDKVKSITEAPAPKNVTQVKSYLGLLTFYNKFLPMLSPIAYRLNELQKKNAKFICNAACQRAIDQTKELLVNNQLLVHFDLTIPIVVTCDASDCEVGAVLSHRIDNVEKPIMFRIH